MYHGHSSALTSIKASKSFNICKRNAQAFIVCVCGRFMLSPTWVHSFTQSAPLFSAMLMKGICSSSIKCLHCCSFMSDRSQGKLVAIGNLLWATARTHACHPLSFHLLASPSSTTVAPALQQVGLRPHRVTEKNACLSLHHMLHSTSCCHLCCCDKVILIDVLCHLPYLHHSATASGRGSTQSRKILTPTCRRPQGMSQVR